MQQQAACAKRSQHGGNAWQPTAGRPPENKPLCYAMRRWEAPPPSHLTVAGTSNCCAAPRAPCCCACCVSGSSLYCTGAGAEQPVAAGPTSRASSASWSANVAAAAQGLLPLPASLPSAEPSAATVSSPLGVAVSRESAPAREQVGRAVSQTWPEYDLNLACKARDTNRQ